MKITDITTQKKNKNRVSVFVDGEYAFSLDAADALRLRVKIGAEITENDIEKYNLESNLSKAKAKAFDIVTRKAVTEKELRTKLSDKGYDKIICDSVIETMREYNYINDADYCERFLEYGVSKGWGKAKICFELKRRGVEEEIIFDAMSGFEYCPEDIIYDKLCSKYSDVDLSDFKQKQKVVRFFASRGFEFDNIKSAIDRFCTQNLNE